MPDTLSIRSYSRQKVGHKHAYHQMVLPLQGVINLEIEGFCGKVSPGEAVVIVSGCMHHFTAQEQARFLVADMSQLPPNIAQSDTQVFTLTEPLMHFATFVAAQLQHQVNPPLEALCYQGFLSLLAEQNLTKQDSAKQGDSRIRAACAHIQAHLSEPLAIAGLAAVACLSPTQFKKRFKQQMGLTVAQYISKLRMEKAHALLLHTDTPLVMVAEQVGYQDYSGFSRRFTQHFGLNPGKIKS